MQMIWQLDLPILTLIIICAAAAIMVKDLLSAVVIFGAYSFLMCLLWTEMGAVDVGFTEAAVGAGVSTVLFIAAVFRTTRQVKATGTKQNILKLIGLTASLVTGIVLLFAVNDFPGWADPESPASIHVSPYYLEKTLDDTSVPNAVTSVLADYRGFDTMFETAVIFCAGIAVIAILRRKKEKASDNEIAEDAEYAYETYKDTIIQTICRQMIPFMQLFALYVIAHGHHSPGGGFQGGVILGASFILLGISYDLKAMLRRMSEKWNILLGNIGIALPIEARSHGILGVEIGVGIAVMAIMIGIYTNIASRGKHDKGL
jgi:multicomponent Na+:H+ antiporter subunit B